MPISQELLEILACPSCHGPLRPAEEFLLCEACRLKYPVREGIPVLLIDQAIPAGDE